MNLRLMVSVPVVVAVLMAGGSSASAQQQPNTLWHFIGIPQTYKHLTDTQLNKYGRFPGMEKKPPLKPLSAPENLASKNPAIKKAAEIKAEEDLKPQKIKALKYLASIGCGCYEGVTDAFMAALEDCTEEVRYVAALSIKEAAGNQCVRCNGTCCTKELQEKMAERAYERDENGCYLEASERVRAALIEAMSACCPYRGPEEVIVPDPDPRPTPDTIPTPDLRPTPDTLPEGTTPTTADRRATDRGFDFRHTPSLEETAEESPSDESPAVLAPAAKTATKPGKPLSSSRRTWQHKAVQASAEEVIVDDPAANQSAALSPVNIPAPPTTAPVITRLPPATETQLNVPAVAGPIRGEIWSVNGARGLVEIHFPGNVKPAKGDEVLVYHNYLLGREMLGYLTVIGYEGDNVVAAYRGTKPFKIASGDEAVIDNPSVLTTRR